MIDTPCAKCGSCTAVCPVYQVTGRESDTARGRIHLLEKLAGTEHSREFSRIFSRCLLCNACSFSCPRGINLPAMVIEARSNAPNLLTIATLKKTVAERCLAGDPLLRKLASVLKLSKPLLEKLPESSGLRLKLGILAGTPSVPEPEPDPPSSGKERRNQLLLFSGCLATHLYPEITSACRELVANGRDFRITAPVQHCCGLASLSHGNLETAKDLARKNIASFADSTSPILTTCASCFSHLKSYPDLFADDPEWREKSKEFADRLLEFASFLANHPGARANENPAGTKKRRVLYHDPCHLRFRSGDFTTPPRKILSSLRDVELVELPGGPRCCGLGGLFNLAHPDLSGRIGAQLVEELLEVRPEAIVSTCSGCLLQLKFLTAAEKDLQVEVYHLADFVNRCRH
ncbi:MAG: (Fe-S)-binding protein [Proteobacteria bacterium]|nr:(Fe-S)-binding protein [Pseudomonadota bacterium]MBU1739592.1 (Fe-S)-binding protein [Pseudomonadota bacterium]